MKTSTIFQKSKKYFYPFLSIFLLFIFWLILSLIIKKEYLIPYPLSVFKVLGNLITSKSFYLSIWTTLKSCLLSFTISFILAIILAIISYLVKTVELLIVPIINIFKSVPTISIILITLIWLPAKVSPIIVASIILFPLMYLSFLSSLKKVNKNNIEMSQIYKVPLYHKITKLYIPSISNSIITQSKNSISLSVKVIIAAEVLAHTMHSIGIQMQNAKTFLEMDMIFAWTIVAIILSYLLEVTITLISKLIRRKKYEYKVN